MEKKNTNKSFFLDGQASQDEMIVTNGLTHQNQISQITQISLNLLNFSNLSNLPNLKYIQISRL